MAKEEKTNWEKAFKYYFIFSFKFVCGEIEEFLENQKEFERYALKAEQENEEPVSDSAKKAKKQWESKKNFDEIWANKSSQK